MPGLFLKHGMVTVFKPVNLLGFFVTAGFMCSRHIETSSCRARILRLSSRSVTQSFCKTRKKLLKDQLSNLRTEKEWIFPLKPEKSAVEEASDRRP
jgi:hypothetical protein